MCYSVKSLIELGIMFIPMLVIMALYAYYALTLRWYLDENHSEFVESSDFPKKMSRTMYYSSFRTGGNWIRFIFSGNDLNDPGVRRLKNRNRTLILAALVWVVVFVGFCFWKPCGIFLK